MSLQVTHKCTDWERLPWGSWHKRLIDRCRCLDCDRVQMAFSKPKRFFSQKEYERYVREGYKDGWP